MLRVVFLPRVRSHPQLLLARERVVRDEWKCWWIRPEHGGISDRTSWVVLSWLDELFGDLFMPSHRIRTYEERAQPSGSYVLFHPIILFDSHERPHVITLYAHTISLWFTGLFLSFL